VFHFLSGVSIRCSPFFNMSVVYQDSTSKPLLHYLLSFQPFGTLSTRSRDCSILHSQSQSSLLRPKPLIANWTLTSSFESTSTSSYLSPRLLTIQTTIPPPPLSPTHPPFLTPQEFVPALQNNTTTSPSIHGYQWTKSRPHRPSRPLDLRRLQRIQSQRQRAESLSCVWSFERCLLFESGGRVSSGYVQMGGGRYR
jgi:hypothetical protein